MVINNKRIETGFLGSLKGRDRAFLLQVMLLPGYYHIIILSYYHITINELMMFIFIDFDLMYDLGPRH